MRTSSLPMHSLINQLSGLICSSYTHTYTYIDFYRIKNISSKRKKYFKHKYMIFKSIFFFIYDSHTERAREAETQAEGEAGSMHREPDVGFDPESPGSRPGPKAGTKPLHHPGIPI